MRNAPLLCRINDLASAAAKKNKKLLRNVYLLGLAVGYRCGPFIPHSMPYFQDSDLCEVVCQHSEFVACRLPFW
jgi:hypothetical protein